MVVFACYSDKPVPLAVTSLDIRQGQSQTFAINAYDTCVTMVCSAYVTMVSSACDGI